MKKVSKFNRKIILKLATITALSLGLTILLFTIGAPKKYTYHPLAIISNSKNTFHALACKNYGVLKESIEFYNLSQQKGDGVKFELEAEAEIFVDLKNYSDSPYTYLEFTKLAKSIECNLHTFLIDANNQANYFYSTSVVRPETVSERKIAKKPEGNILTLVTHQATSLAVSFNGHSEERYSTAKSKILAIEELPIIGEEYKISSVNPKIKHYAFHRWLLDYNSPSWLKIKKIVSEFNISEKNQDSLLNQSNTNLSSNKTNGKFNQSKSLNNSENKVRNAPKATNSGIRFVNNPTTRDGKHIFYVKDELGESQSTSGKVNYLAERYTVKIPFQARDTKNAANNGKLTCRFLDSKDNSNIKTYFGAQIKKLDNTAVSDSWEVIWSPTNIGESAPLGIRIENPQGEYLDYIFSYVVKSGFPSADSQKSPVITPPSTIFIGPKETAVGIGKIIDSNRQDYQTIKIKATVISEPKPESKSQVKQINHQPTAHAEIVGGEDGFARYFYLTFFNSYGAHPLNSGTYGIRLTAEDFMGFKSEKMVTVNVDQRWENPKTKPTLVLPNILTRYIGVYTLYQLVTSPKFVKVKGWGDTFPGFDSIPGSPAIPGSSLEQQENFPLILFARGSKKYPTRSERVKIRVENDSGKTDGLVNIEAKDLSVNLPPAFQTFYYDGPSVINPGSKVQWTMTLFDPNQLSEVKKGASSNQPQPPMFFNNQYGASISRKANNENGYVINWTAPKSLGKYIFSIKTGDLQGGITNHKFSATVSDEIVNPKPDNKNPGCREYRNGPGVSNQIKIDLDNTPKELNQFYLKAIDPQNKYPLKVNMFQVERATTCTRGNRLPLPEGFSYQYNQTRNDVYINWKPTATQAGDPKKEYRLCTELENKSKIKGYCYHVIEVYKKNSNTTSSSTSGSTTGTNTDTNQSGSSSTGTTSNTTGNTTTGTSTGTTVGETTGQTTSSSGEAVGGSSGSNTTSSTETSSGSGSTGSSTTGNTGSNNSSGSTTAGTNSGSESGVTSTTGIVTGGSTGSASTSGSSGTGTVTGSTGSTGTNTGNSTTATGSNTSNNSGSNTNTGNTGTNTSSSTGSSSSSSTGGTTGNNTNPSPSPSPSPSPTPLPSVAPSAEASSSATPSPSPEISPTPFTTLTPNPTEIFIETTEASI